MGNLATPLSVQKLRAALHAKAKDEPGWRFHALYDKLYREDVLRHAYRCCRANHGAPGVDGVRFEDIEASGVEPWLDELAKTLKEKRYQAEAIRRVYIPKPNGKLRPLGIPTIRDRVVQMAMVLVLGPIFEADLPPEQYAYRPDRNAHDAIRQVHSLLTTGHTQVVDADLAAYFDSIPHAELMKSVVRRIVDRHVLHLIKMWLEVPVEETDERGGKKRTTRHRGRSAVSRRVRHSRHYLRTCTCDGSCWGGSGRVLKRGSRRASSPMLMIWSSAAKARRRTPSRRCGH